MQKLRADAKLTTLERQERFRTLRHRHGFNQRAAAAFLTEAGIETTHSMVRRFETGASEISTEVLDTLHTGSRTLQVHEFCRLARERVGEGQSKIASQLDMRVQTLSDVENGLGDADDPNLQRLVSYWKRRLGRRVA